MFRTVLIFFDSFCLVKRVLGKWQMIHIVWVLNWVATHIDFWICKASWRSPDRAYYLACMYLPRCAMQLSWLTSYFDCRELLYHGNHPRRGCPFVWWFRRSCRHMEGIVRDPRLGSWWWQLFGPWENRLWERFSIQSCQDFMWTHIDRE